MPEHIVLAYSGGLDTSVAVHWLGTHYGAKVTAVLIDLGQPIDDLEGARQRALHNGAAECRIIDARDVFAAEYVAPAIQANALYEGVYPLATALGRPLIAKLLAEVATEVGADAVAHGCTGKGNDQVRIEAGIAALAPHLVCLAPQRSHPMTRDAALRYADEHGLQLPPNKKTPYSTDENLWGRSAEGHDTEDPARPVPETAFSWTVSPQAAPDEPATFTLTFADGLPVALDGTPLPLGALIARLNTFCGQHGIGRIDHVENRLVGIKSREVYEAPAAIAIMTAKQALEALTLTRDEAHLKPALEQQFSGFVYDGKWFHPVMAPVQAFIQTVQKNVQGTVTLQAYKGNLTLLGRESPVSLWRSALATYADGDAFHHQAAEGFIEIWALPQQVAAKVRATALTAGTVNTAAAVVAPGAPSAVTAAALEPAQ